MSALFFLFRRKFASFRLKAYIVLGIEPGRVDLAERAYRFYLGIILVGWTLAMSSWAVFTSSSYLKQLRLSTDLIENGLFLVMALWLVITPWLATRNYDLYKFELADIQFLSNTPLPPPVVVLWWFGRALWNIGSGIFVIVGAILGSALSTISQNNDFIGLGNGLLASAFFLITVNGLRWVFHLRRFHLSKKYKAITGYWLSAIGILLVLLLPRLLSLVLPDSVGVLGGQGLFWPASLTAWLVINGTSNLMGNILGMVGLAVTTGLVCYSIIKVAKGTTLTPAFEDSGLGSMLRSALKTRSNYSGVNLQLHLNRRLKKGDFSQMFNGVQLRNRQGTVATILYRRWLGLKRLPIKQVLLQSLLRISLGSGIALTILSLWQNKADLAGLALPVFLGNLALINFGTDGLRQELAHISILASWPLSRFQLIRYYVMLGFATPLVAGELALVVGTVVGQISGKALLNGLFLWPLLLAISALVTVLEFYFLVNKWSASPETVPAHRISSVIATALWLLILLLL